MDEHKTQSSGITADKNVVGVGHGENPYLVLSVAARKLGNDNMFNAIIINLLTGTQVIGRSVDYRDINKGIWAKEMLSVYLTGTAEEIRQLQQTEEKKRKATGKKAAWNNFLDERRKDVYNSHEEWLYFGSGYYQWGNDLVGGGGTSLFKWNFFSFYESNNFLTFLYIGLDSRFGYLNYSGGSFYGSGALTPGLIFPFSKFVHIYANGVLEMGYFGGLEGVILNWMTPAFECGLRVWVFDLNYRGTWYNGYYTNSVGLGVRLVDWY
jgi:hypothetical protein